MNIRILRDDAEIRAVFPAWRALNLACSGDPFTDPDWYQAWRTHLAPSEGWTPYIATLWDEGRLLALAALAVERHKGLKRLCWAGAAVFDYCDTLCRDPAHAEALWDGIRREGGFHLARLGDVCAEARSVPALTRFARSYHPSVAYHLALQWKNGQDWLNSLSSSRRKRYARFTRRLTAEGVVRFDVYTDHPPSEVIGMLLREKLAWAAANGHQGVFGNPGAEAFFRNVIALLADAGTLCLSTLRVDETIVAANLDFRHGDRLRSYVVTYDSAWSRCSPGMLLIYRGIMWSIEQGFAEYDMMRGAESYKRGISPRERSLCDYAFGRGLLGRIAARLQVHRAEKRSAAPVEAEAEEEA